METLKLGMQRTVAGVIFCMVALSGCGGDKESTPEESRREAIESAAGIEAEYLPNGNRIISYDHDNRKYANILQVCEGRDLLEQTSALGKTSGNAIFRSVGHPACEDGMLTPEDFEIPG